MLMTEEGAKTKWCPFAKCKDFHNPETTVNRPFKSEYISKNTSCLASNCMAWRWVDTPHLKRKFEKGEAPFEYRGYCGLAGRPE